MAIPTAGKTFLKKFYFVHRAYNFFLLLIYALIIIRKSNFKYHFKKKHPVRFESHPYYIFDLVPNYASPDGRNTHNEHRFRGKGFSRQKDEGVKRVVCVGESTTYCLELKDGDTYPDRLERHLNEMLERRVEVINAGIDNYTSAEVMINFIMKIQPLKPDLIVYYYTVNDVIARTWKGLSRDYREFARPWKEVFPIMDRIGGTHAMALRQGVNMAGLSYYVRRYEHSRSWDFLTENPSSYFRDNITVMSLVARHFGIEVLLVNPPFHGLENPDYNPDDGNNLQRGVFEHRRVIADVGEALGVSVLDMLPMMPVPPPNRESANEYYVDPVHFTEKGADIFASGIARHVVESGLLDRA